MNIVRSYVGVEQHSNANKYHMSLYIVFHRVYPRIAHRVACPAGGFNLFLSPYGLNFVIITLLFFKCFYYYKTIQAAYLQIKPIRNIFISIYLGVCL